MLIFFVPVKALFVLIKPLKVPANGYFVLIHVIRPQNYFILANTRNVHSPGGYVHYPEKEITG